MDKPTFAVFEPAFMGLVERVNLPEAALKRYAGAKVAVVSDKRIHAYLHGRLQDIAGFDIPQLLAGQVTTSPRQECRVVMPDETIHDAVLHLKDEDSRYYGLILTPDEPCPF